MARGNFCGGKKCGGSLLCFRWWRNPILENPVENLFWRANFGPPYCVFKKFGASVLVFCYKSTPKVCEKTEVTFLRLRTRWGRAQPSKSSFFGPIFNFAPPCWFFAMRRPFRNSAPFWGQNWGVFVPQKVNTEGQNCCRLDSGEGDKK